MAIIISLMNFSQEEDIKIRSINLLSHAYTCKYLESYYIRKFNRIESLYEKNNTRESEERDLIEFIKYVGIGDYNLYNYFFMNYNIPQIFKEFD